MPGLGYAALPPHSHLLPCLALSSTFVSVGDSRLEGRAPQFPV